jgi:hypothetical protein
VCGLNLTGATGKITTKMQDLNTFLDASWDFVDETANGGDDIWAIELNQYPSIYRELYSGGDGGRQDPFKISSADDLVSLGKHEENYYDCFVLTHDIDLSGWAFDDSIISQATLSGSYYVGSAFMGSLDGQGHTVDHLTIQSDVSDKDYVGLFGVIGSSGEVSRLSLKSISITGANMTRVGGLCGLNSGGTIKQCSVSGSMQGKNRVGGIGGVNEGYFFDCYASGDIEALSVVGGICGMLGEISGGWGHIERCYSTTSVQSESTDKGGLAGYVGDFAFMRNCFWDTTASGMSSGYYLSPGFWGIIENVQGYTTSQMKERANFIGWDFVGESVNGDNEIWRMCVDDVDTPRLSWEFARDGDFACSDGVDLGDLQALAECWLMAETTSPTTFSHACDGNGDGVVDLADFGVLAENLE